MAMNEDSVVSSLNELRRMANERARREAEARAKAEAERRAWEDRNRAPRRETQRRDARTNDPRTRTLTEGFPLNGGSSSSSIQVDQIANVSEWRPVAGGELGDAAPAPTAALAQTLVAGAGDRPEREMLQARPSMERKKSVAGPVLLTILLLGGAAGAGFVKLQQDWQTTLRARDATIARMEEAKGQAVEAAARAEAQARLLASSCEKSLKAAPAERAVPSSPAAAAAAPGTAAPVVAANAVAAQGAMGAGAGKYAGGRWHRRWRGGRRARAAAAAAAAMADDAKPAAAPLPKIAGKKKITDDPLAGLKL